jgi:hypothetical protein
MTLSRFSGSPVVGSRPETFQSLTMEEKNESVFAFYHTALRTRCVAQFPIEGLGILAKDFDALRRDSRKRTVLHDMLDRTGGIEEVSGASFHHMTVGRKRKGPSHRLSPKTVA